MGRARSHDRAPGRWRRPRRVVLGSVLVLATLAGMLVALQVSVASAFRTKRPQIALNWVPNDARARTKLASQLLTASDSSETQELAAALALDAIRRDPLMPAAFRTLALVAGAGDAEKQNQSLPLLQEAQRLSRRDQLTQLQLIRHAIAQRRFSEAVAHFDIALRTSLTAQQTLFPLLSAAMADKRMFDVMLARMMEKPDWAIPFLAFVIQDHDDPQRVVSLARPLLDPADPRERQQIDRLLRRLVERGELELAWQTFVSFGLRAPGGGELGSLLDGGFESGRFSPPFGWILADEPDLFATLERDPEGNGNVLLLTVGPGRSGEAARQLLRLPVGHYKLRARLGSVPQDPFERPEIRIRCVGGASNSAIASVKPMRAGSAPQWVSHTFSIGLGCPFQWITLAVVGGERANLDPPWIDDLSLSRVAN